MIGWFKKKEDKELPKPAATATAQATGGVWQAPYGNWNDLVKPLPPRAAKVSLSMEIDPLLLVKKNDGRLKKLSASQQWRGKSTERNWRKP